MCIKQRPGDKSATAMTANAIDAVLPKETFTAYKILKLQDGKLVSPVYHKVWSPGVHTGGQDKFNDQTGIYAFMLKPSEMLKALNDEVILELRIDPVHVTAAGYDKYGNMDGTAVVATRVEVTQEAFDKALNVEAAKAEVKAAVTAAKPEVAKAVKKGTKRAAKEKKAGEKTVASARKKMAKKTKKSSGSLKAGKKDTLEGMTVDQLRTMAKVKKIAGYSKMNKTNLLAALSHKK